MQRFFHNQFYLIQVWCKYQCGGGKGPKRRLGNEEIRSVGGFNRIQYTPHPLAAETLFGGNFRQK